MRRLLNILLLVAFVSAAPIGLSACNTVEGLGEDTRRLGDAITGASRNTRGY
jgi:predicted small secreted protein